MFDFEYFIQAVKEYWQHMRNDGGRIIKYFETNGLYRLAIFEIDELKGWLDLDLCDSRVVIKKRIWILDDFMKNEELMKKTEALIISIWDVIRF